MYISLFIKHEDISISYRAVSFDFSPENPWRIECHLTRALKEVQGYIVMFLHEVRLTEKCQAIL